MKNSLIRLLVLLLCASTVLPQRSNAKVKSMLIRKDMPSVYIEFMRSGTAPPLFGNEKEDRIWLRLHNNTKWTICFCSFPVKSQYGEIGLVYDVKHNELTFRGLSGSSSSSTIKPDNNMTAEIPQGYNTADTCTEYNLRSGKSIVFSIPRDHLRKNLYIESKFWPEWENRDNILGNYPESFVSFPNLDLQESEKQHDKGR
jgi:hypothetical protein